MTSFSPSIADAATLTSRQARRIKTVVLAIALISWLLPIALVSVAAPDLHTFTVVGLSICGASLVLALLLAWTLYCPWCAERLFFVSSIWNSPSWRQLGRQYVPYEVVANSRLTCPHCRARFTLSNE